MSTDVTDVCTQCGEVLAWIEGKWLHAQNVKHPALPHHLTPWKVVADATGVPLPATPENATPESRYRAQREAIEKERGRTHD